MAAPFEEEGEHHLVEALVHIDRHVVDLILDGVLLDVGHLLLHTTAVELGHFVGERLDLGVALHIDEMDGLVAEVEVHLFVEVVGVEEEHLMFAVTEMTQRVEEGLVFFAPHEGIGEDHHQRTAVHRLGQKVYILSDRGGAFLHLVGVDRLQQVLQERVDITLMHSVGAYLSLHVDLVGEEGESEGVALAQQQLYQCGGSIDGEGEFVGVLEVALPFDGEEHRRRVVDDQLAAEVGLLLEALHEELVGTTVELPVDIARRFAGIVQPMLGKLNRESVEGTLVQAGDETLHHLAGKEVERFIFF